MPGKAGYKAKGGKLVKVGKGRRSSKAKATKGGKGPGSVAKMDRLIAAEERAKAAYKKSPTAANKRKAEEASFRVDDYSNSVATRVRKSDRKSRLVGRKRSAPKTKTTTTSTKRRVRRKKK